MLVYFICFIGGGATTLCCVIHIVWLNHKFDAFLNSAAKEEAWALLIGNVALHHEALTVLMVENGVFGVFLFYFGIRGILRKWRAREVGGREVLPTNLP